MTYGIGSNKSLEGVLMSPANVRFGSKADMCSANGHVRFTPNSDIKCDVWGCLLWAISGHSRREYPYSHFQTISSDA
jgi:hypothetical protein